MKVSFIIPLHNEEKNCLPAITRIVNFAVKNRLNYEIIPVDDRSFDKTGSLLKKIASKNSKIKPFFRKEDGKEKGNTMGKALIEGTQNAKGDYIIWTMGDLADSTDTYKDIIGKLNSNYDLVFGSRYMPGGSSGNLAPLKAYLSSSGTILAKLLFGIPVHDITNAFRGFKRSIFSKINLEESGFAISPEFAIKAHIKGFKLGEVPTTYTNRVEGVSNFKLYNMTRSYLRLFFKIYISNLTSRFSD